MFVSWMMYYLSVLDILSKIGVCGLRHLQSLVSGRYMQVLEKWLYLHICRYYTMRIDWDGTYIFYRRTKWMLLFLIQFKLFSKRKAKMVRGNFIIQKAITTSSQAVAGSPNNHSFCIPLYPESSPLLHVSQFHKTKSSWITVLKYSFWERERERSYHASLLSRIEPFKIRQ